MAFDRTPRTYDTSPHSGGARTGTAGEYERRTAAIDVWFGLPGFATQYDL